MIIANEPRSNNHVATTIPIIAIFTVATITPIIPTIPTTTVSFTATGPTTLTIHATTAATVMDSRSNHYELRKKQAL
jgi:hypothetical protein